MYVPGQSTIADQFLFCYVVPHHPAEFDQASPFMAYLPGIMETHRAFLRIAQLPRGVLELVSDRDSLVAGRAMGSGYRAVPLHIDALSALAQSEHPLFLVVYSTTDDLASEAQKHLESRKAPALHVTPGGVADGCPLEELTRRRLWEYAVEVLEYWEANGIQPILAQLLRGSVSDGDYVALLDDERGIGFGHLLTIPNEATLSAMGTEVESTGHLIGTDNEPYWAALREGVGAIRARRAAALGDVPAHLAPFDLILTSPAMMKEWKSVRGRFTALDREDRAVVRGTIEQLRARETFPLIAEGPMVHFPQTSAAMAVAQLHSQELGAYTSAVATRASGQSVPTIRIPTSVNDSRKDLEQLAGTARSYGANRNRKLNRIARKVARRLAAGIPDWVLDDLRACDAIKCIADAPLEWLLLDDVPLMLRSHVSRIAVTPGNFSFGLCVAPGAIVLPQSSMDQVLIIDATASDDPAAGYLRAALEVFNDDTVGPLPEIVVSKVESVPQLARVLRDFEGAVSIWYGHGTHRTESDVGALLVGEGEVDAWTLKEQVALPPIVLLGVCDAHPYDASHATTASGLLNAGAITVLAAGIPVSARNVATWIVRSLLRLGHYIPILLDRPHGSMRWSEFLPGLQRRQYVTEALTNLRSQGGIDLSESEWRDVSFRTGMAIDTQRGSWYNDFVSILAETTEIREDAIRDKLSTHAFFTEALAYTQFGNPECIVIVDEMFEHAELPGEATQSGEGSG